jgi:hypothetical protein
MLDHTNIDAMADMGRHALDGGPADRDRCLLPLPLFHVNGIVVRAGTVRMLSEGRKSGSSTRTSPPASPMWTVKSSSAASTSCAATSSARTTPPGVVVDGWLHTGDIGHLDADGYLTLVGRAKDRIIRSGENIYPKEIEDVLTTDTAVLEAAAIGVPDDKWGQVVDRLRPASTRPDRRPRRPEGTLCQQAQRLQETASADRSRRHPEGLGRQDQQSGVAAGHPAAEPSRPPPGAALVAVPAHASSVGRATRST